MANTDGFRGTQGAGDQNVLSPGVMWGQNKEKVFLKVDITEISSGPEIDLKEDQLSFKAHGSGARGPNYYSFNIHFYRTVDPKKSKYKVTGRAVEFELSKSGMQGEIWPRLTLTQSKAAWIKTDFDHFAFEDSEPSDIEGDMTPEQHSMLDKLEKELKEAEGSAVQDLKRLYLFIYNLFQWVGYSLIFTTICYRAVMYGLQESRKETYSVIGQPLMVCQMAAVLEVIHPLLGWVKTGVFTPTIQVFGRGLVLFGLLAVEPRLQEADIVWYLFLAWTAVELVRYPYYMLNVIDREWHVITWLRYTAWIPPYPIGFVSEGILMMLAVPLFEESGKWSVSLPNLVNCSFHFSTFLKIYMVSFLLGMYILMQRMYEQRKKKLKTTTRRTVNKKNSTKTD